MLNISFYLREPQAEKETPIIMRLVLRGEKSKYPTEERIHPDFWDAEKQRTKTFKKNAHGLEVNVFLESLYNLAVTAYREFQHAQGGRPPSLDDIKRSLDQKLN